MRSMSPARRTLPSTSHATFNRSATSRASSFSSRQANAEVRDATRRPELRVRRYISSSDTPSANQALASEPLRFVNGRTAIEFDGGALASGADARGAAGAATAEVLGTLA